MAWDSSSHMAPHVNILGGSGLEGQGGLVGRIISPLIHIATLAIPVVNLLTKSA